MTITFIFKKDWTGTNAASPGSSQMSFKKGQYVTGEVVDSGVKDPSNYIVITNTEGQARIPFGGQSYQGENAILESPSAPWLAQAPVDTTPRGDAASVIEAKSFFGLKNIGDKAVMIFIITLLILIAAYFIYLVKKQKKK